MATRIARSPLGIILVLTGCAGTPPIAVSLVLVAAVAACTAQPSSTATGTVRTAPIATAATPSPVPTDTGTFVVGTSPTARGYHQLVSVGGDLGTLLLSGFSLHDITVAKHGIPKEGRAHPGRTPDAVWAFSSSAGWTYRGPPDRLFATNQIDEAAFHPASGLVLMHLAAYQDPSARLFDPRTGAVTSTGEGAAWLRGPFMAYDAGSDRIIVFGGLADGTWAYDPAADTWTRMQPATHPSARNYGAMAYDPVSDRVILFGGSGTDDRALGDTWAYDVDTDTWTELSPQGGPGVRQYTAMVYDPVGQRMILFGGLDAVASQPPDATWAYDSVFPEWDHTLADTWAYDPAANTWTELAPASAPPARGWHDMAYELETGLIVLFGGGPARGSFTDETWLYDLVANAWSEWSPPA
jgi:hypothetical protein